MKKRKVRIKHLLIFLLLVSAIAFVAAEADFSMNLKQADTSNGWELILVDSRYRIPDNWESELLTLSCKEKVDKRIYPDLQDMFDTALSEGIDLVVRSGYRTESEQRELLLAKAGAFINEGYGKKEAFKKAREWVAVPGTSEHQLGLAVDINAENGTESEEAYRWLKENSYRFGFVIRYPQNKVHITGISYEPWHFRYVGKKHAQIIYEQDLCLEEYVEIL